MQAGFVTITAECLEGLLRLRHGAHVIGVLQTPQNMMDRSYTVLIEGSGCPEHREGSTLRLIPLTDIQQETDPCLTN